MGRGAGQGRSIFKIFTDQFIFFLDLVVFMGGFFFFAMVFAGAGVEYGTGG